MRIFEKTFLALLLVISLAPLTGEAQWGRPNRPHPRPYPQPQPPYPDRRPYPDYGQNEERIIVQRGFSGRNGFLDLLMRMRSDARNVEQVTLYAQPMNRWGGGVAQLLVNGRPYGYPANIRQPGTWVLATDLLNSNSSGRDQNIFRLGIEVSGEIYIDEVVIRFGRERRHY